MKATIHKTDKTTKQLLDEMKKGKPVRATDFCASMGITTITFN